MNPYAKWYMDERAKEAQQFAENSRLRNEAMITMRSVNPLWLLDSLSAAMKSARSLQIALSSGLKNVRPTVFSLLKFQIEYREE